MTTLLQSHGRLPTTPTEHKIYLVIVQYPGSGSGSMFVDPNPEYPPIRHTPMKSPFPPPFSPSICSFTVNCSLYDPCSLQGDPDPLIFFLKGKKWAEQNSFNSGGRFIFTFQFYNQITISKYLYFNDTKDTPVNYKLKPNRAVKSFAILQG